MAKDKFDTFMSQYSSGNSLGTVVESEKRGTSGKEHRSNGPAVQAAVTPDQRRALAEARNVNRGRPATGAMKEEKTRIGFEVNAALAAEFKQISYKTGIPFGQLYTEAMADLVRKYNAK